MIITRLRKKIRRNAAHLLDPGEQIQAVIHGQTLAPGPYSSGGYVVFIATDRRILYCRGGWLRWSTVRNLICEFPRETRIGPAHGFLWYKFRMPPPPVVVERVGGQVPPGFFIPIWIPCWFFRDVAAADEARPHADATW